MHTTKYSDRPRISLTVLHDSSHHSMGMWICHNDYFIVAYGNTPREAYDNWNTKMLTLTTVPRFGIWNKRDVMSWYNRGCPTLRSYLGSKRFISYNLSTDHLVLQG